MHTHRQHRATEVTDRRSRYFLGAWPGVDDQLAFAGEGEHERFGQSTLGVEAQTQLPVGRAVGVEGFNP